MEIVIVFVVILAALVIISRMNLDETNRCVHCGTTRKLKEFKHGNSFGHYHYVCEKCIAEGKPVSWGKINNWFGY